MASIGPELPPGFEVQQNSDSGKMKALQNIQL